MENKIDERRYVLATILAITAVLLKAYYFNIKGFWPGLGFFLLGSATGSLIGYMIWDSNKESKSEI